MGHAFTDIKFGTVATRIEIDNFHLAIEFSKPERLEQLQLTSHATSYLAFRRETTCKNNL